MKRLEENDLFVKPEKCRWKVKEVEFLGVVIRPGGVRMQEEKVDGVLSWPTPRSAKDVQKFMGLTNYYRRFIQDFSRVAKPLNMLVEKDRKWEWGVEQQKAFKELKRSVMNRLDPIEELYDMYLEEEDTPRIVEIEDDGLDLVSDAEGLADPYMDL